MKFKLLAVLTISVFMWLAFMRPVPVNAAISDWQRGVTINPDTPTDYASANFQQTVRNAASTGANYITLIVQLWQDDLNSSTMHAGYNTPTDQALISGIQYIHSLGLNVSLNIHVDPVNNAWRAYIDPANKAAWFAAYQGYEVHYAQIAQANPVQSIILGTELYTVTSKYADPQNVTYWDNLIAEVRGVYSGLLSYDAQPPPDHADLYEVDFWSKLDFIGLSAYFSIAPGVTNPTQAQMQSSWQWVDNNVVKGLYNQWHKPVVFTEIGYRSTDGAHNEPWNWTPNGNVNLTEQANDYQALFSYWANKSYFGGVQLWDWFVDPNYGGSNNNDYTAQNKPAQAVMTQYFKGSGIVPTTTPPSSANYTFSASLNPAQPVVNQNLQVTVAITPDQTVNNVLVDIEFYNSQNQKVNQQFFSAQNLSAGQANNFIITWSPSNTGSYHISAGVFSNDWSANYTWAGNIVNFNVNSAPVVTPSPSPIPSPSPTPPVTTPSPTPSPAPPANLQLNVWWPTNGSSISGLQPFKAKVEGLALNSYALYWSVDNGVLNSMADNNTNGAHKETLVNVSNWNWNSNGQYSITFTAKDTGGKILLQQTIMVHVTG